MSLKPSTFKFCVLVFVYFVLTCIIVTKALSADRRIVRGKLHGRQKRDVDILAECATECLTTDQVQDYDVLLEYDLEEPDSANGYSDFYPSNYRTGNAGKTCSYACKILDLNRTGELRPLSGKDISFSVEEVTFDETETPSTPSVPTEWLTSSVETSTETVTTSASTESSTATTSQDGNNLIEAFMRDFAKLIPLIPILKQFNDTLTATTKNSFNDNTSFSIDLTPPNFNDTLTATTENSFNDTTSFSIDLTSPKTEDDESFKDASTNQAPANITQEFETVLNTTENVTYNIEPPANVSFISRNVPEGTSNKTEEDAIIKPPVVIPKVIRLTMIEAEMVEAGSARPTDQMAQRPEYKDIDQRFWSDLNDSLSNISLGVKSIKNITEKSLLGGKNNSQIPNTMVENVSDSYIPGENLSTDENNAEEFDENPKTDLDVTTSAYDIETISETQESTSSTARSHASSTINVQYMNTTPTTTAQVNKVVLEINVNHLCAQKTDFTVQSTSSIPTTSTISNAELTTASTVAHILLTESTGTEKGLQMTTPFEPLTSTSAKDDEVSLTTLGSPKTTNDLTSTLGREDLGEENVTLDKMINKSEDLSERVKSTTQRIESSFTTTVTEAFTEDFTKKSLGDESTIDHASANENLTVTVENTNAFVVDNSNTTTTSNVSTSFNTITTTTEEVVTASNLTLEERDLQTTHDNLISFFNASETAPSDNGNLSALHNASVNETIANVSDNATLNNSNIEILSPLQGNETALTNNGFSFSGNFTTGNDSSFPIEFKKTLIDKLKKLDNGANVVVNPQNHPRTTLQKVDDLETASNYTAHSEYNENNSTDLVNNFTNTFFLTTEISTESGTETTP